MSLRTKVDFDTPYRYLISENYLIFYQISDDNIEIHRIINGRRNYIKILFHNEYSEIEDLSEDASE